MTENLTPPTADVQSALHALDRIDVTPWHRRVVALVGIGSFFNFYEIAVGTLMLPLLPTEWNLSSSWKAAIVAAPFAGEFLGALLLTPLADRFGRRRMFQINLISYAVLSLLCATADNETSMVVVRLLVGIGLGAELALVDSYLTELLPSRHRGRLMAWSYAFGMLAVPVADIFATALPHQIAGIDSWRWMLVSASLGAGLVWVMRQGLPESPRWLATRGRDDEAVRIISDILAKADPLRGDATKSAPTERGWVPAFGRGELRRRITLVGLMEMLGTVGVYGFSSIAPLAILAKGIDLVDSLAYSALSALGFPLGPAVLVLLSDRVQRRTLVIVTAVAVAVAGFAFGLAHQPELIVLFGFLTGLSASIHGTVARAYGAELFPTHMRSTLVGSPPGTRWSRNCSTANPSTSTSSTRPTPRRGCARAATTSWCRFPEISAAPSPGSPSPPRPRPVSRSPTTTTTPSWLRPPAPGS
ncbi:MFS transporter [Nocardia sp. ET3-3]|uniref:MFS transporter n=1 Tax=Nocardia terrae TaxID=2675851 RepID=A0A7K1US56_9NOCA|nr:MFS transporter [Nocardia terrae]MVU77165.1 MFS transporter [Nocardia terrae]